MAAFRAETPNRKERLKRGIRVSEQFEVSFTSWRFVPNLFWKAPFAGLSYKNKFNGVTGEARCGERLYVRIATRERKSLSHLVAESFERIDG
jgi:hypothetical protein